MLGSAIEADGCHTKAEGGIFNDVQAECLPADIYGRSSISVGIIPRILFFPKLRQAGWMTKPLPPHLLRIKSPNPFLLLQNQPTNQSRD